MKITIVNGDDLVGEDPQRLAGALAARGHDVIQIVRRRGRRQFTDADNGGHRMLSVSVGPTAVTSASELLPYVGDWAGALEREWAAEAPDVVHAYGWLGGLAAQLAARRAQVPIVQSFLELAFPRGSNAANSERLRIEPLLARSATWVTGESTDDVDTLSRIRRSRARVSALTSGVDVDQYTPCGRPLSRTNPHRVVSLAPNPLPANGFDIAISALSRVPTAELLVAETDPTNRHHDRARAGLRCLANEMGVADRVQFAGTVPANNQPALLRSADVVVCTPRQPPRATTVLKAMASGVVVVAPAIGVLNDVVVDNVTGVIVSPESPGGLAAALRSLLAQSFQCDSMGASGRGRALSRYAWDRIALDALNIYHKAGAPYWSPSSLQSTPAR